MLLLSHSPFSY